MRKPVRLFLFALLLAGLGAPAQADVPFLRALVTGDKIHTMQGFDLDEEDRRLAKESQDRLLADTAAAPGTTVDWNNARSGNAGSVALVASFDYDGLPCRQLRHEFTQRGRADPVYLQEVRCQVDDGSWKAL